MCRYYTTHIASLFLEPSHTIQNGDDIWPNLRRLVVKFMKVQATKTWKKLTTGVQQLVKLLFNNNFINPGHVL